jgi:peptidyl-prolyl cis-trans isomerase D
VLKKIKGGAKFAALAKKHSEDSSKSKGGDLGVFIREDMLPEFSDAAFALQAGEVSGIVRTNFGFHLIKVTEVTPGVIETFDKVRPKIEKILRAQRAARKLKIESERLPQRISKEGLEAVAAELKREIRQSGWVDGTGTVGKLGAAQGLYSVIRNGKQGDGGVWRRNPVQGHVFYQIAEKKASYQKPLAEVRKQVAEKVISERMAEAALREAKSVYKALKTYKEFKAAAKKRNVKIITSEFSSVDRDIPEVGINREFQETAFRLAPGQPIGLSIDGKTAHLMILKKRHIPKSEDETNVKLNITARIQQKWAEYFVESELERLKGEIEIEVVTPELVSGL